MNGGRMAGSEKRRVVFAFLLVLLSGAIAGGLVSAFRGFVALHPIAPVHFRDLAWRYFSFARFTRYATGLTAAFALIWGLTNYYIHRRTGAPLSGLLLLDGIRFLLGAPPVAALVAFGPTSGRPLFLNGVGLLYLALLAWKLHPFLKAALLSPAPAAGKPASIRRRDVWFAAMAVGLGFFLLDHPRSLNGDEPHYLVYADSLMHGRGADLGGSYDPRITGRFFNGLTPDGQTVIVTDQATGKRSLRPYHYPGLAILVLPAYALAGAGGAKLVILMLTAVGLTGLFALLRNIEVDPAVAARGVAFLACTSPFITYGLQIYPETAAGAALVWCFALLTEEQFGGASALCVGGLAAFLPWLHVRYAPLSAALILIASARWRSCAGKLFTLDSRSPIGVGGELRGNGEHAHRSLSSFPRKPFGREPLGVAQGRELVERLRAERRESRLWAFGQLCILLLPPLASAAALLGFYRSVYGSFSPSLVSALPSDFSYWASLSWRRSAVHLFALFLDSQGGVIAYAPALLLAPLGAALLYRRDRRLLWGLLLPIALETGLIAAGWRSWHGDWSPPSRFMACVCPLLAALAVVAYEYCLGNAWLRRLCHGLLAAGALIGALMIADPEAMYNMHTSWSVPAITQSYPPIRLAWLFPNYADLGARTLAQTAIWIVLIAAATWLALRFRPRDKAA
jgi:hypothetical protein